MDGLAARIQRLNVPREVLDLVRMASNYVDSDPQSALAKSRVALEKVLNDRLREFRGSQYLKLSLGEITTDQGFMATVPVRLVAGIDAIRRLGNKAAHGDFVDNADAARAIAGLVEILEWHGGTTVGVNAYDGTGTTVSRRARHARLQYGDDEDVVQRFAVQHVRENIREEVAKLGAVLAIGVIAMGLTALCFYAADIGADAANRERHTGSLLEGSKGCAGALAAIVFGLAWRGLSYLLPFVLVSVLGHTVFRLFTIAICSWELRSLQEPPS
jgi:hypothetical protein